MRRAASSSLLFWILLPALFISCAAAAAPAAEPEVNEYQVKAAFLYNFAKFVEWPEDDPSYSSSSIQLCLIGLDPFGDSLDRLVEGREVMGRKMRVRRRPNLHAVNDLDQCNILFLGTLKTLSMRDVLDELNTRPILTVGEGPEFTALGGMIRLMMENNSVGFEINPAAATRARLKISSKLLRLARLVDEQDPETP